MAQTSDMLPFGEWAPDLGDFQGSCRRALNVISVGAEYRPIPTPVVGSDVLGERVLGAVGFFDPDGTPQLFVGTQTKLYRRNGTSWEDVSKSGGYSTANDGRWSFAVYGARVIATNYVDNMQSFVVGSSTDFADLSAQAPKARDVAIVNNFIVAVGTQDGGGSLADNVQWCAIDDPTVWVGTALNQADAQQLKLNGGANTRIFGSQEYGIVFQERAIWRMTYVGSPLTFAFQVVEQNRGLRIPSAAVADGNGVYYRGDDGFYYFDGVKSMPIGQNKVDRYFFDNFDTGYEYRINAVSDPINKAVVWSFPNLTSNDGNPNEQLIYNWGDNRWTQGNAVVSFLFQGFTLGYTLEELDTISASLDALPASLDSRIWAGGKSLLSGFNASNALVAFTGTPGTAILESAEGRVNPAGRALVTGVIPYTDGSCTVAVGHRATQQAATVYTSEESVNAVTGEANFLVDNRYHRVRVTVTGDFERIKGYQFVYENTGVI